MEYVELKSVQKIYPGNIPAVQDFSLGIRQGEFLVLVGPSGCGKSTLLRMIAGLESISSGELWIDGVLANQLEAKSRDIAMVFQNYALYPHMTVYKNMALGLELRHIPRREIDEKIRAVAAELDISYLLNRKPRQLSGGQRQRVALGRAVVREPKAFLLDEPLSNLDAELRVKMRMLIASLHQKLGTTFIYVTHDQSEAMTLADRICVMDDGFIQQVDTPQNLYDYPCNLFVAGFIGTPQMNRFTATLCRDETGFFCTLGGVRLPLPHREQQARRLGNYVGEQMVFGIRPEHILCGQEEALPETLGKFQVSVDYAEPLGAEQILHFHVDGQDFVLRTPDKAACHAGDQIRITWDSRCMHVFSQVSGQALLHGARTEMT